MWTIRIFFLVITVILVHVHGSNDSLKESEKYLTSTNFMQNVKTAADELKQSTIMKKKAIANLAAAIGSAKIHVIRNVTKSKVHALKNTLEAKVSKVAAIKEGKLTFVKDLFTILANKTQLEEPIQNVTYVHHHNEHLHSPLFILLSGTFSKIPKPSEKEDGADGSSNATNGTEYILIPLEDFENKTEEHKSDEPFTVIYTEVEPQSKTDERLASLIMPTA